MLLAFFVRELPCHRDAQPRRAAPQPRRSGCCRTQDMEEKVRGSSGEDITSFRCGPESREMAIEEVRDPYCRKLFSPNQANVRKAKEREISSSYRVR